jgi:ABC-type sugar transport system permease subunit
MARLKAESRDAAILLSPFFVFLAVFMIYPLIASFYFTLNDLALSDLNPIFIGIGNYVELFSDKLFQQALLQTLAYLTFHTAVGVPFGLAIALLFNQEFAGRGFARACLLIPWSTPPIVAAMLMYIMLNAGFGPVIYAFERLGLVPTQFTIFGNPNLALLGLAIVSLWKSSPLFAFIFLSGLQNLPSEIVESARVYGASGVAIFRRIIVPFLKPTLAVNCILSGILALSGTQAFDIVIGITNGGPGYRTYMLYFLAWSQAFPWNRLGYGSTIAYVVTVISVVFALVLLRIWYRRK